MDMTQLRQQIDQVDQALVELFRRRMDISSAIADYKKEQGLAIFDPARERQKLSDVASKVEPELESHVKVLYSLLFELSRSYQSEKNAANTPLSLNIAQAIERTPALFPAQAAVACTGGEDGLPHRCLQRLIRDPQPLFFSGKDAVLSAVGQGMCRYGLLPLEQSTMDDLAAKGFYLVRSLRLSNQDGSFCRYGLFGKALEIYPGADRTSLMLVLPNRPGSLYRVLARLYTLGLNISKLESRSIPANEFQMQFYFDLETSVYAPEFVHLMRELEDLCDSFQYLGSYTEVV